MQERRDPRNERPADTLGRRLHDLRISVTDRCNFRCSYCMPKEVFGRDYEFLARGEILSFEEITRLAGVFARHGVKKLRLTGGEPTLRSDLPKLIGMLRDVDGIDEVAMTTNGSRLVEMARELKAAGLDRVTVSLDSLDDKVFRAMNDVDFPVSRVLEGIEAAAAAGLEPVKVNMVVRRGMNEHTLLDLVRHFRGSGHIIRFIEFMDVGNSNGWRMDDVVPAAEIIETIGSEFRLEPLDSQYAGEVANRFRYADGAGEIGMIASVTKPFCGGCTRARLSADGKLYTCLFAAIGHDLRKPLRDGKTDDEISEFVARLWSRRKDRYSELRTSQTAGDGKVEMSYIGG